VTFWWFLEAESIFILFLFSVHHAVVSALSENCVELAKLCFGVFSGK